MVDAVVPPAGGDWSVGMVHAYVDQKLLKSNKIKSLIDE